MGRKPPAVAARYRARSGDRLNWLLGIGSVSLHRYAPRRDANQPEIVAAVRKAGAVAYPSNGEGCDLWVGAGSVWEPWEIKDGSKPPSKQALTASEAQMQLVCRVDHLPYSIIRSVDEALARIAAMRAQ